MLAKPLVACTSIFNTVPVLQTATAKIAIFMYRSPYFCFSWRRPCDYHAICCMDEKTIQCLRNPSQHVPIYLQQFPSYTMLKSMHKSKNRYFLPHFGFPWGRPWGNHAKCCMDGNCLAVCAHLTITVSQIEPDIGRKSSFFSYPLAFDAPVKGVPVETSPSSCKLRPTSRW